MSEITKLDSELLQAVRDNRQEGVRSLIKRGAWLGATTGNGYGVIDLAIEYPVEYTGEKNLDLINMLIKYGAPVNVKTRTGWTPLHAAVVCMQLNTGKLLIDHGADINVKDDDGQTPVQLSLLGQRHEGKVLTNELARYFYEHRVKLDIDEIGSVMAEQQGEDKPTYL